MEAEIRYIIPYDIILPIGFVLLILITIVLVLFLKNREINKIIYLEKERFMVYIRGIETIRNSNADTPAKKFADLSKFVRGYFKEYLNLGYSLTYLDLENIFIERKKPEYARFCRLMSDLNYSGRKNETKEILEAIEFFSVILKAYKKKYYPN